ncbi:hypothetical protein A2Z00_05810 [Candidatus Gottesmanbacteria bacterium RBG_13_45_10]|uniref:Uncharacterized protein n=1 Tax=Candidatus Gottesmanbacteria bacterium RBG_13_45_10 TaxID=1798370 RepID=A0A1F5ZI55_9BACT|nr:MAG: hypothetical protein A2Z00_05810 [Candidatus Gottesmanbacteria bacterium RBG_13_45_10]
MGSIRAGLRERWKSFAVATRNILFSKERIVRVTRAEGLPSIARRCLTTKTYWKNLWVVMWSKDKKDQREGDTEDD